MVPFLKAIPVSSALKTFLLSTNFVPDPILGSEERKINIVGFFPKGTFRIWEYYPETHFKSFKQIISADSITLYLKNYQGVNFFK